MSLNKPCTKEATPTVQSSVKVDQSKSLANHVRDIDWSKFDRFNQTCRLIGQRRLYRKLYEDQSALEYVCGILKSFGMQEEAGCVLRIDAILKTVLSETNREYTEVSLPVTLKLVEAKVPLVKGVYTLFNKLSSRTDLTPSDTFEQLHRKRLDKWLFTDSSPNKSEEFYEKFRVHVKHIFGEANIEKKRRLRFENFILNRNVWATAGATSDKDHFVKGAPKTKRTWAYSMSDKELLSNVREGLKTTPTLGIVEKDEPGAVRLVILDDNYTYLLMSYVSYHLDRHLGAVPGLYNYKSNDQKLKTWMGLSEMRELGTTGVSIDYSGWDEGIDLKMQNIILEEMRNRMSGFLGEEIFDMIKFRMNNNHLDLEKYGLGKRRIINGVPSGSRWTTLLNSICNLAINRIAINELGLIVYNLNVLGDDVVLQTYDLAGAKRYMDLVSSYGFTINELKSHISRDVEFLKITISDNGPRGVPLRAVRAIMWGSEDEAASMGDPMSVMNQRVDLWIKYFSRNPGAYQEMKFRRMVVDDLNGAVSVISKTRIKELLHSPRALGGLGLFVDQQLSTFSRFKSKPVEETLNKVEVLKTPSSRLFSHKFIRQCVSTLFLRRRLNSVIAFDRHVNLDHTFKMFRSFYWRFDTDVQDEDFTILNKYFMPLDDYNFAMNRDWENNPMRMRMVSLWYKGKYDKLQKMGLNVEAVKTDPWFNGLMSLLLKIKRRMTDAMFNNYIEGKLEVSTPAVSQIVGGEVIPILANSLLSKRIVSNGISLHMGSEFYRDLLVWYEVKGWMLFPEMC